MRRALVALALLALALPAWASGEHDRRLRVEIAILHGDAKSLIDPATPPLRRQGLRQRIRSSLDTLGMLTRYAAQEGQPPPELRQQQIADLRALFASNNIQAFAWRLDQLKSSQPLDMSDFLPLTATPARLHTGQSIYQSLCIGCHQNPDQTQPNPAPDLFSMAAAMPRDEFVARMLGGIHGVRLTTLQNPFTDEEIASLTVFFERVHLSRKKNQLAAWQRHKGHVLP
jgi:mono/diheme cytochrome c family protein